MEGLPWWNSGQESTCQCRGHRFDPWPRKIPHAAEQLSSQGNWPGEKVKSDKMYQSQPSSPIPEAELRSGVALPVTRVCIKFPHPNPHLGKLETFPLPVPFQIQPTRWPGNGYVSTKHHNTMGRDRGHQYNWQTKYAPHFTGKETGLALHHLPKFSQLLGSRVQIRAHSASLVQSLGPLLQHSSP